MGKEEETWGRKMKRRDCARVERRGRREQEREREESRREMRGNQREGAMSEGGKKEGPVIHVL